MPTHATDDIVVFLPGITGSVLRKDNKDVWGTSAGAIFRAVVKGGADIKKLALEAPDDPSLDDLGDGVTATRLVPDTHIVPGLWKIDGYSKLTKDIRTAFGLEDGKSALDFPYDWRRNNRVSARKLQRSIEGWLHERRKERPKAKAVLVAHSMGGIVSRYYLEVLGGWENVRTLVTFGTPYGGSLNALDFIANGHVKGIGPFKMDLSKLLRSFDSVYQLLPTYECVDAGEELKMIGDVPGMPGFDYARVAAALAFHDEIADGVRARLAGPQPQIAPVVGIEQPTYQSARFAGGEVEVLRSKGGKDESGDGTVPRVSAVPFELAEAKREVYAAERHSSLQNHDAVLAHLRGVLSRPDIEIRRTRAGGPATALSLSIADAFPMGSNVEFSVQPSEGQPALFATLTTAEGTDVAQAPLRRQPDGTQRGAFDPPPEGIYRLRIEGQSGANVAPVTDLFLVAQDED